MTIGSWSSLGSRSRLIPALPSIWSQKWHRLQWKAGRHFVTVGMDHWVIPVFSLTWISPETTPVAIVASDSFRTAVTSRTEHQLWKDQINRIVFSVIPDCVPALIDVRATHLLAVMFVWIIFCWDVPCFVSLSKKDPQKCRWHWKKHRLVSFATTTTVTTCLFFQVPWNQKSTKTSSYSQVLQHYRISFLMMLHFRCTNCDISFDCGYPWTWKRHSDAQVCYVMMLDVFYRLPLTRFWLISQCHVFALFCGNWLSEDSPEKSCPFPIYGYIMAYTTLLKEAY